MPRVQYGLPERSDEISILQRFGLQIFIKRLKLLWTRDKTCFKYHAEKLISQSQIILWDYLPNHGYQMVSDLLSLAKQDLFLVPRVIGQASLWADWKEQIGRNFEIGEKFEQILKIGRSGIIRALLLYHLHLVSSNCNCSSNLMVFSYSCSFWSAW
jgi:hypothetical protein